MKTLAVIPARYDSHRLPHKPLLDICGKPMIQYVYEAILKAKLVNEVVVATDDIRIVQVVKSFGGQAIMTSPLCASGTDRLVEVAHKKKSDIYLNIQSDEPLLRPQDIDRLVIEIQKNKNIIAATLCYAITDKEALDSNIVKVVRSESGNALYFSRTQIPFNRDGNQGVQYWGHVGMYAYRPEALKIFAEHEPGMLERAEKLEQLRLLQHGISIQTIEIPPCAPGVDTPEDLERVRSIVAGTPLVTHTSSVPTPPSLANIRLVITDVDGVLTDGGLYYGPDGECIKRFHAQDGLGMVMLRKAGIRVAVLSGRDCPALRRRLKDLGIDMFRLGKVEKRAACESLLQEAGVSAHETLFIGDDLPDLDGFACCGLGVTVANARDEVKRAADIVLQTQGGQGAFRELVDMLLEQRQE